MSAFLDTPRPAHETTSDVFEALLGAWRESESALIGGLVGVKQSVAAAQEAEADRDVERWRERFRSAVNW